MTAGQREWWLSTLHFLYPAAVFLYFIVASAVATCTLQTHVSPGTKPTRSRLIFCLFALFNVTYFAQLAAKITEAFVLHDWPAQHTVVGLLSCILVFGILQTRLGDASGPVWYPIVGTWCIALVLEPTILILGTLVATTPGDGPASPKAFLWLDFSIVVGRIAILVANVITYALIYRAKSDSAAEDEEQSPLIPKPNKPGSVANSEGASDSGYGTNSEGTSEAANSPSDAESSWERQEREGREKMEKRLQEEGSWFAYAKGFMIFFPYIWPVNNRRLQVHAFLVGLCLLAGNALNVLIPRQMGIVLDTLGDTTKGEMKLNPWVQVLIFVGLRLAASESGINYIRQILWLPVEFYSNESLTVAAYSHIMNLSAEFHDSKSSSDLIVAISHGSSISNMLESICFSAMPMLIDLVVAFIYLSVKFGPYEGFITFATGVAFIHTATWMLARMKESRKVMVKTYFEEHSHRQAGIQGWTTVSAFNQIPYEESRYSTAARNRNSSMKSLYYGYYTAHAFQYLVLLCGLVAGSFLAVYQVLQKQRTAGDFAMLLSYWAQLTTPLQFFATLGRNISQDLVYAERLLDVMLAKPTVVEKPDAKPLVLTGASVEFRDVGFSYDKKKNILKGVSLSVPSGKTVAFVGATGAGKSTILRLLDRFYDVTSGSILIDGQDIRDVQLSSLRQSIGIVPQSPVLFDDTIMNNIRYARLDATDEEIYDACKAAAIHNHILTFTEGYKTRVGERGVKISGGELQRIAIARAILKRPEIVMLDEATSSVDTETEQKIQTGLRVLCEGRTTFIVAHRLSTVMNADMIFVIAGGEVVEHGSHEELIGKKGKYNELWSKQIFVTPKGPDGADDKGQSTTVPVQSIGVSDAESSSGPKQPTTAAATSTSKESRRPVSTPKLDTRVATGKANEQVVKTPSGHKKEGSRLNPGATEFTPRSTATPKLGNDTPITHDWAEDAEANSVTLGATVRVPADIASPTRRPSVKKENARPASKIPKAADASASYRHHEPKSDKRSVSDPVSQQASGPSTPTRCDSAPKQAPLAPAGTSAAGNSQQNNSGNHESHIPGRTQARGGRKPSRGRGPRSRGFSGGASGKRGGRATSDPHKVSSPRRTQ